MSFDACTYILKMLKYLCILIHHELEKNTINILDIAPKQISQIYYILIKNSAYVPFDRAMFTYNRNTYNKLYCLGHITCIFLNIYNGRLQL